MNERNNTNHNISSNTESRSNSVNNNTNADNEQKEKLKKFIILGTLTSLVVIGWHVYENYFAIPRNVGVKIEDEILDFTNSLYAEELRSSNNLLNKFDVNIQGKTKTSERVDKAAQPLFSLHEDFFTSNPDSTVKLMKALFDNYILETQQPEIITDQRDKEELAFLNAILATSVMKKTMAFLSGKGKVGDSYASHFKLLKEMWFENYARNKAGVGSSGFEHVFLAELKRGKVLGLHNWIYFAEQEKQNNVDYQGYMDKIQLSKKNQILLTLRSVFHGKVKPYNSILIGTTPELEMSLYTVCFLLKTNKPCSVQLGSTKFNIMTYSWKVNGKLYIASAFPATKEK